MADIDPFAFQRGFQNAQNVVDTARQNRLAQLVFDQKQQELSDNTAANNALSAFYQRGDSPESRQQLYGQLPGGKIMATQQSLAQADKTRQDAQKSQRDQLIAQYDWADKNMAGVRDQAGWDDFRQRAAQVYPDIAAKLPAQYDPATIQASRERMIPIVEQWKEQNSQRRFDSQQDTTRRGQDMSAQTATRGQDITLRGQDMTDARARDTLAQNASNKAPTEFQGKSAAYGARAEEADRIIRDLGNSASPLAVNTKQAAGRVPLIGGALEAGANAVMKPENQQLEQAQRDFVNAVLRQESGAAISQGEFENARRQYFPQPGDSEAVIAQKAANRKLAIDGFKRSAGKAAFSAGGKPSLSDIFGN